MTPDGDFITRTCWEAAELHPIEPPPPLFLASFFKAVVWMLRTDPALIGRHRTLHGVARYITAELAEQAATLDRWADDGGPDTPGGF